MSRIPPRPLENQRPRGKALCRAGVPFCQNGPGARDVCTVSKRLCFISLGRVCRIGLRSKRKTNVWSLCWSLAGFRAPLAGLFDQKGGLAPEKCAQMFSRLFFRIWGRVSKTGAPPGRETIFWYWGLSLGGSQALSGGAFLAKIRHFTDMICSGSGRA